MAIQAQLWKDGCTIDWTADGTYSAGDVVQLYDGRAGVLTQDMISGDTKAVYISGIFTVLKTTSMVLLRGGRVFWDYSAAKTHYKQVNDRDFLMGVAFEDAASSATTCKVILNERQNNQIDFTRDAVLSVPTGTQAVGGFGYPKALGGANSIELTATSEAQCIDMLSVDKFDKNANAIIEAIIRVPTNGSGAAVDFNIGIANGTHTTDADSITEHVFFHIDGGSTAINAQSKDGTTTVTATDTTTTITAGSAVANRKELWIDCADTANIKLYVDGARVLSGSTFKIDGATGPFGLLAHLEKTTGTTTGLFVVDRFVARLGKV